MKFAKVFEQTLIEEEVPEEWLEAAIQYKALKKCINKVVMELKFLGLEKNNLKVLIEDQSKHTVVEMNQEETVPTNKTVAQYTLLKTKDQDSDSIIPMLKISLDGLDGNRSNEDIERAGHQIKTKIESLINSNETDASDHHVIEIKEENNELVLSPQSTRASSPPIVEEASNSAGTKQSVKKEIYIMLNSDIKFFQMLDLELESIDKLRKTEEDKMMEQVQAISNAVQALTPPGQSPKKSDLYHWRELFKIYLDSEIYFKYNDTDTRRERNAEDIKRNLESFQSRVRASGVLQKFNKKKSMAAFDKFLMVNLHLLKVLQFQSINSTAMRKILKKFDKQTSLGAKYQFPQLLSNDHVFVTGDSIAKSICFLMQNSLVTLIPQLDDYTCPVCCSIAYKPIRLLCGHAFCVRCLVKLKQSFKVDCPMCRFSGAVEKADSFNLDVKTMQLMRDYFPIEVREKLREREKEKYEELIGNKKCVLQ